MVHLICPNCEGTGTVWTAYRRGVVVMSAARVCRYHPEPGVGQLALMSGDKYEEYSAEQTCHFQRLCEEFRDGTGVWFDLVNEG